MSRDVDILADAEEKIIDTRVGVSYFFLTESGGELIPFIASSRGERLEKMPKYGIDATRPYAFGHLADHGTSRYQVAGTSGELIDELRQRLNRR